MIKIKSRTSWELHDDDDNNEEEGSEIIQMLTGHLPVYHFINVSYM